YIEDMQPDGLGALNLAFEQLKEKLSQEGLFSSEYKKPLPAYPAKIAVITSPTGAAVQDILRILGRRWPVAEVVLCPCAVQGQSAVPELVRSIKAVNQGGEADVIIIGRGGGALEDLWAFNHEELARAIFASHIPVVSAVGHETDFTICDFVSDVRASTPSAAAELVTPDIEDEKVRLKAIRNTLNAVIQQKIADCSMRLDSVPSMTELGSKVIRHKNEQVMNESKLLLFLSRNHIAEEKNCFAELAGKLDALSPLKVLERGYAVLTHNGQAVHSVNSLDMGETLTAILSDGELDVTVNCLRRENNER
ncbi:MAG: exodeoxyribonuclease VII large subunit, partial [Oscillospiraceae bacterium]